MNIVVSDVIHGLTWTGPSTGQTQCDTSFSRGSPKWAHLPTDKYTEQNVDCMACIARGATQ